MSIGVQSYPELYTMLLGWDLYDKIWDLLTQTGLAYFPFIGMILRNITKFYVEQSGPRALRSMEVSLLTAIILILFAVMPCIPLKLNAISYVPVCSSKVYYPGDTGTTYDKAFSIPSNEARVPMWWYIVISVSEGLTSAANTMVGCVPDLRKMVTLVDMTQIADSEMKREVQDFENACYVPARTQFYQDKQNNNVARLNSIRSAVKQYGTDDTEWVGSHSFNEVYYQNLTASRPIPGFAYNANHDINAGTAHVSSPVFGIPSCYEWWNDSNHGLKNRLYQTLPKSFSDEFKHYVNDAQTQDDVIKRIISNTPNGFENANTTIGKMGYSHVASMAGILYHQLEEYPKLYAAGQAAPIIQSLLLLMIYTFLPFAVVFNSYRPSSFITGAILIFSVIFWGFIWRLVSWTDSALMQALYSNWFTKQGAGATLADMIVTSLIIFSPIFWFIFMGTMGVVAGDIASSFSMGINKIGSSAAGKGAEAIKSTAQAAGTAAFL